jgi:hypothetical protein
LRAPVSRNVGHHEYRLVTGENHLKASEFVKTLRKKFVDEYETNGDRGIAGRLGISLQTLRSWAKSDTELAAFQITNAFLKAQSAAVADAQYHTIKPIVEFYPIECSDSKQGAKYELLPLQKAATTMQNGVRTELCQRNGLYLFYDTRGKALYAGKAKTQSLWKEMNLAFNRDRDEVQAITLVSHPEREQEFEPAYKHPRQPKDRTLKLHDLAAYFSAYWVMEGMIDDLEALLVRGFTNDLLNIRMEKFDHLKA